MPRRQSSRQTQLIRQFEARSETIGCRSTCQRRGTSSASSHCLPRTKRERERERSGIAARRCSAMCRKLQLSRRKDIQSIHEYSGVAMRRASRDMQTTRETLHGVSASLYHCQRNMPVVALARVIHYYTQLANNHAN